MSRPVSRATTPALNAVLRSLAPLIVAEAYLATTVALFALGPWPWPVEDGTMLYLFLLASHTCLAIGYVAAGPTTRVSTRAPRAPALTVLAGSMLIILLAWPTVATWAGGGSIVGAVMTAWVNPATMYRAASDFESQKAGTPWITYARTLSAPLTLAVLPLLVVYWRRLGRTVRLLAVGASMVQFAVVVSSGRNKGLADLLIVLSSCWAIVMVRRGRGLHLRKKIGILAGVAVTVLVFATFFERGSAGRAGPTGDRSRFTTLNMTANYGHPLVALLPGAFQDGAVSLMGYFSIGYYGLYLSLREPFLTCYGFGHSNFLRVAGERLFGLTGILERTIPYRVQEDFGWDMYGLWHTAYPWLASDIGFTGVALLMIVIGWVTAKAWMDARQGHSPAAVVLFTQLATALWYLPANNQILAFPEQMVAFWVWLAGWFRYRRSRERRHAAALKRVRASHRAESARIDEEPGQHVAEAGAR